MFLNKAQIEACKYKLSTSSYTHDSDEGLEEDGTIRPEYNTNNYYIVCTKINNITDGSYAVC